MTDEVGTSRRTTPWVLITAARAVITRAYRGPPARRRHCSPGTARSQRSIVSRIAGQARSEERPAEPSGVRFATAPLCRQHRPEDFKRSLNDLPCVSLFPLNRSPREALPSSSPRRHTTPDRPALSTLPLGPDCFPSVSGPAPRAGPRRSVAASPANLAITTAASRLTGNQSHGFRVSN
jgi:hypothetical protein